MSKPYAPLEAGTVAVVSPIALARGAGAGAGAGVGPVPVADQAHATRIASLARKVADVKAKRLNGGELFCKFLSFLGTAPNLFLSGFTTVPINTQVAIFRFGKLETVLTVPGLYWITPGYERVSHFAGAKTHITSDLRVIDASGNPIIVRALLEYAVEDPAALFIATDNNMSVLYNMTEQVVRSACSRLPLVGEAGADIRTCTHELGAQMVGELQQDATVFGVFVQRLVIVEARYDPEIASQMLMKQQATAMVGARELIVQGAIGIIRDTLRSFPTMSEAGKERLTANLMITLTAQDRATATNPIKDD